MYILCTSVQVSKSILDFSFEIEPFYFHLISEVVIQDNMVWNSKLFIIKIFSLFFLSYYFIERIFNNKKFTSPFPKLYVNIF